MAIKKVVKKTLKQVIAESKKPSIPGHDPWDLPEGRTNWQDGEDPLTLLKIIGEDLGKIAKDLKGIIATLKKREVKGK